MQCVTAPKKGETPAKTQVVLGGLKGLPLNSSPELLQNQQKHMGDNSVRDSGKTHW